MVKNFLWLKSWFSFPANIKALELLRSPVKVIWNKELLLVHNTNLYMSIIVNWTPKTGIFGLPLFSIYCWSISTPAGSLFYFFCFSETQLKQSAPSFYHTSSFVSYQKSQMIDGHYIKLSLVIMKNHFNDKKTLPVLHFSDISIVSGKISTSQY